MTPSPPDFPEEDDGAVAPAKVEHAWRTVRDRVAQLLLTAPEGERLREGALLVIAGRPNAGKSSLFNALLGAERAIVTEVPGTTRDAIEAYAVLEGFPFRLVDTAGLRESVDRVERLGIEVSRKYLAAADLVVFCEAADEEAGAGEADGVGAARAAFLAACRAPVVRVRTKVDLAAAAPLPDAVAGVSVLTGTGLAPLKRALAEAAFARLLAPGHLEPLITRARPRAALERPLAECDAFGAARQAGVDAAAPATHLPAAVRALPHLIALPPPP